MSLHLPSGIKNEGDIIEKILRESKTIAVVGLSSNPARPSYGVAAFMQRNGYRIIPVNPGETEVLGEKAYARLEDVPEKVDIVDVFRRSSEVGPVADSAIAIGAKVLWLQMGISDETAEAKAAAAGLIVVSDACLKVELGMRRA
jgi:predicted CoA-binding protein